jgi:histidinol-phosphate aminotransferase
MNRNTIDRLAVARAAYEAVPLYDPKRSPVEIDLTDNTNLWGVPPGAERALRHVPISGITRYPSLYAAELKTELASYIGVDPANVVTGCGSDDILDSAMRAFGEPGDLVAGSEPSFAMIPIFARMNGLEWTGVTELPSHQPDMDELIASRPRILYFCSPNNPTGALVARDAIERAISETSGVVFIDEAYAEFAGVSSVDLISRSDRVLVIRTMSKAFGLAGLRVGYAVGNPALVLEVEKSRGPYKLNALAERVAATALREDQGWVSEHIDLAVQNRERLASELRAIGIESLPSHANFLLAPVAESVAVGQALRARGVAVRPFPSLPGIGDAIRISVGPWPMMERFLDALVPALRETNP